MFCKVLSNAYKQGNLNFINALSLNKTIILGLVSIVATVPVLINFVCENIASAKQMRKVIKEKSELIGNNKKMKSNI